MRINSSNNININKLSFNSNNAKDKKLLFETPKADDRWKEPPIYKKALKYRFWTLPIILTTFFANNLNMNKPQNYTPTDDNNQNTPSLVENTHQNNPTIQNTEIINEVDKAHEYNNKINDLLRLAWISNSIIIALTFGADLSDKEKSLCRHELAHLLLDYAHSDIIKAKEVIVEKTKGEVSHELMNPIENKNELFRYHLVKASITCAPNALSELKRGRGTPIETTFFSTECDTAQCIYHLWEASKLVADNNNLSPKQISTFVKYVTKIRESTKEILKQYNPNTIDELTEEIYEKKQLDKFDIEAIGIKYHLYKDSPNIIKEE